MATANLKNQIAKKESKQGTERPQRSIKDLIKVMEPQIKLALPSVITPERFTRIALSAVSNSPKLADCTQQSFLAALMNAAQLGLEPNTPLGQAYLIPYFSKKKNAYEAQFQIGYKGLIDLAHRSGEFKTIYAKEVYENDEFHFEFGLEPKLIHIPALRDRGEIAFYYGVFTLVNGGFGFDVMTADEVKNFAKSASKSFGDGPWQSNFVEMAKKTLIKRVLKSAPIKTEFARQVQQDMTVKTELNEDMSDVENEIEYEIYEDTGEVVDYSGTPFSEEEKEQS